MEYELILDSDQTIDTSTWDWEETKSSGSVAPLEGEDEIMVERITNAFENLASNQRLIQENERIILSYANALGIPMENKGLLLSQRATNIFSRFDNDCIVESDDDMSITLQQDDCNITSNDPPAEFGSVPAIGQMSQSAASRLALQEKKLEVTEDSLKVLSSSLRALAMDLQPQSFMDSPRSVISRKEAQVTEKNKRVCPGMFSLEQEVSKQTQLLVSGGSSNDSCCGGPLNDSYTLERETKEDTTHGVFELSEKENVDVPPMPCSGKKKETRGRKKKVKGMPNRPVSAYNLFFGEQRKKIGAKHPEMGFREMARLISRRWKTLSEEELQPLKDAAAKDYVRYKRAMDEFQRLSPSAKH